MFAQIRSRRLPEVGKNNESKRQGEIVFETNLKISRLLFTEKRLARTCSLSTNRGVTFTLV